MNYDEPIKGGICFLLESFYPVVHGGATQIRLIGERLTQKGVKVTVITRQTSFEQRPHENIKGINVLRVKPAIGMKPIGKYLMIGPAALALIKKRNEYNYVIVSDIKVLGVIGVLVSKLLGKMCILRASSCGEMDGSYAFAFKEKGPIKLFKISLTKIFVTLRNPILRLADQFLSIATVITKELIRCGIPRERIIEFACGVDTDLFIPAVPSKKIAIRNRLGLPNSTIFIYTGRLAKGKGLHTLIEVWDRVVNSHKNVFLVLVGAGQGYAVSCEDELKRMVIEKKLETYVRFVGKVDNVYDYLNASDCFVFPTEYEALGNSLLEAMSSGLICVATRVGGIVDVIKHNVNGLLFEKGNEKEFYEIVEAMLIDRQHAQQLADNARKTIVEKFNIDGKVKVLVELLAS
jgi:glycosyltransferase involved in cell wall biosynthesis